MDQKIDAIVLRSTGCGKSDRMLTVLSRERGKISVFAKYARNAKNKLHCATNPFVASQMLISDSLEIPSLKSAQIVQDFPNLSQKLLSYYCACFVLELINRTLGENQQEEAIFSLLYYTLLLLDRQDEAKALSITTMFLVKFLALEGSCFDFSHCQNCRRTLISCYNISLADGSVFCPSCTGANLYFVFLSPSQVRLYNTFVSVDIESSARVKELSPGDMQALFRALYVYFSHTYQLRLKSYSILEPLL